MIDKLPLKTLVAIVVAASVWALWPDSVNSGPSASEATTANGQPSSLVSAIQPISDAQARDVGVAVGSLAALPNRSMESLNQTQLDDLQVRFKSALQLQNVEAYKSLIQDYPSIVEPYLNLASLYAAKGDLVAARSVLLQGFESSPKAGMLFDHLSNVNGALAAQSYQQALDTNSSNSTSDLRLAQAIDIVTPLDQSRQIERLKAQLSSQQNQGPSATQLQQLKDLENQIAQLQQGESSQRADFSTQLSQANSRISELTQSLSQSQASEREAQARVVRAEQNSEASNSDLARKLAEQQSALSGAQAELKEQASALTKARQQQRRFAELETENMQLVEELAKARESGAVVAAASQSQNLEQQAESLVKSWARAWSAQNVERYVSHYANDYSSSRSLSRTQWLAQRQIRLTNKDFINVRVSNFKVKDFGSQFSVTFSQYYQSNTVDDTVTKRLVFSKRGSDLSDAKIVSERLVTP